MLSYCSSVYTLSWTSRFQGFLICFVLGFIFSFTGSFCLLLHNGLILFAIFYTFGNITTLASTCFLMGPVNQLKKMFAPTRFLPTIASLVCIVLTLCSAFWWTKVSLVFLFGILQFLAMTWYSISYIPFAREGILKCCQFCII